MEVCGDGDLVWEERGEPGGGAGQRSRSRGRSRAAWLEMVERKKRNKNEWRGRIGVG